MSTLTDFFKNDRLDLSESWSGDDWSIRVQTPSFEHNLHEVSFFFGGQNWVQIEIVVDETFFVHSVVADVLLDLGSEICEYGISLLLAGSDTWVLFCLVVVDKRFKADLAGTLGKVVESTLHNS